MVFVVSPVARMQQATVEEGDLHGPGEEAAKETSEVAGGPSEAVEQPATGEQRAGKLEASEGQQLWKGMDSKSQAQGPPSREHSEYSFPGTGEDPNAMEVPQPDIPAARTSARRGRGRGVSGRGRGRAASPRRKGRSRLAPSDAEVCASVA